jgi:S-adenosylmethionine:diacylglycerol 3-amino-3-carboxypropyl transferase
MPSDADLLQFIVQLTNTLLPPAGFEPREYQKREREAVALYKKQLVKVVNDFLASNSYDFEDFLKDAK